MRVSLKISEERLKEVVSRSRSVTDVLRKLGYRCLTGGTHAHISRRIKSAGLDTSHFIGKLEALKRFQHTGKHLPSQILVVRPSGSREFAYRLRRALTESGVQYICAMCEMPEFLIQAESSRGISALAKLIGVSETAIRKRIRRYCKS